MSPFFIQFVSVITTHLSIEMHSISILINGSGRSFLLKSNLSYVRSLNNPREVECCCLGKIKLSGPVWVSWEKSEGSDKFRTVAFSKQIVKLLLSFIFIELMSRRFFFKPE